ncbi:DUF262 domain-containing protein [Cellulosimicrobium sp. Marseille-Q4280]|uniref:DUF262 domain-containing protein n=1 Tax=Cellulosimicrobium sp. Marseille-Q4280 TaxID=2937992 RepID=UPI00203BE4B5|nr:DUF262 domain-containing protein [Cellulosimicrobium sp. Marseille-Q4280]
MDTMQTAAPLAHRSLDASNRHARELARQVVEGHMSLDAPYQRGSVWTERQQRDLVRSWMLGLPVPAIVVNRRYAVDTFDHGNGAAFELAAIDGKQRLQAAIAWFFGDLAVPASWFAADDVEATIETSDGPYVRYRDLAISRQRLLTNRCLIPVAEATLDSIAAEAEVFGLLNGAGVAQTEADMARAAAIAAGE